MSANQSNLSNPHYGYDMVVATTQASVNATMEEWLSKYKGESFVQAYVYNPDHGPKETGAVPTDFDKMVKTIGFDPFSIPDGTPTSDPRIKRLLDYKFMFAFKTNLGIPDFPVGKIPPVIQFNKEGSYVTYNMVCKTFEIIVIEPEVYGDTKWLNLSQEKSGTPWIFSFTIDLDLQNDNINNHFSKLPPETQRAVKNLGEDAFSVQQLFLDLNAAGLSNQVTIEGLKSNTQAYNVLTNNFINTYLADLAKNGGILLGYSVVSHKPFPQNVSLIPTDLNIEICSYKGPNNKPTADYEAYTLNYLVMSGGRTMPSPAQFAWNWIDKDEVSKYAGVMAINRTDFIDFLNKLLSPSLNLISRKSTTDFSINCIKASFKWGYKSDDAPHSFKSVSNGGSHVLTYNYTSSSSSKDDQYCGVYGTWGNFSVDYSAQSDVYLEGSAIKIVTTLKMHCHLNILGGVTDGNFAKKTSTTLYTLGVDNHGKLTVTKTGPDIKDQSEKPNPDWWSKFISLGEIDGKVAKIKSSLQDWIQKFLISDSTVIEHMLNGSSTWVFPGGKTFTFTNVIFSENQDLVADVLYVSPSN